MQRDRLGKEVFDTKTEITVAEFHRDIGLNPKDARAFARVAIWWHSTPEYAKSLLHFNQAIRYAPTYAAALSGRASLLATCPNADYRDGSLAREDATKALGLAAHAGLLDHSWKHVLYLEILAAACAEAGSLSDTLRWQDEALAVAVRNTVKAGIRCRRNLYESATPLRQEKGLIRTAGFFDDVPGGAPEAHRE